MNPLVLSLVLIGLNLTHFNAIRLLFVQTMTSLTITTGSRSAANAVGHESSTSWQLLLLRLFLDCGSDSFSSFLEIGFLYFL